MSTTEGVHLVGQQLAAADGLDDDVQAGQDGVSLGQEVAIGQELLLRNTSESLEFGLVFGVSLDEAI